MSSTPKKRPKLKHKPKFDSNAEPKVYSSPTSSSSLNSLIEPPPEFFPSKHDFARLIAVLAIAFLVAVGCNFFFSTFMNHRPKPFCNSDMDSSDFTSSSCEPCPINGVCHQGELECLNGYRKHRKSCIEDGVISKAAKEISEWVEFRLCEANARFLCHGTGTVWVEENDIWQDLDRQDIMENVGSDNNTFTYAKVRAKETFDRLFEARTKSHGVKELKCPDSLAENYKPFTCRIRQWIVKHAFVVLPVFSLLVGCTLLLWKVRRRLHLSSRAEELYDQVCEILEDNALVSKRVSGESEPWVVTSRLRDHLLLPRERRDPALWSKVEELIQEDSRIDRYPTLVKGEAKVVWEWQVEGSLSSSRKKKNRQPSDANFKEGIGVISDKQHFKLKHEPKLLNT